MRPAFLDRWMLKNIDTKDKEEPKISAHPKRHILKFKSRIKNKRKMIQASRRANR